jgi:hypothetical protein
MSLYTALTQVLAPYAAKLNGLLTGWDGTKYTTPGEAVRRQFTDLHVMIGDVPGEAIVGSAVSYDGTSSDLSATNMQAAVDETNEKVADVNGRLNDLKSGLSNNIESDINNISSLFSSVQQVYSQEGSVYLKFYGVMKRGQVVGGNPSADTKRCYAKFPLTTKGEKIYFDDVNYRVNIAWWRNGVYASQSGWVTTSPFTFASADDVQFVYATLDSKDGVSVIPLDEASKTTYFQRTLTGEEKQIITAYVSTSGNDSNAGHADHPLKTVNKALERGAERIMMLAGDYRQQIDLSKSINGKVELLKASDTGSVYFRPSEPNIAVTETKVEGYTKVYSSTISVSLTANNKWLFQRNVQDSSTLINNSERMPQQRGVTYRMKATVIRKCSSNNLSDALNEIDNSNGYLWYIDNNTLYFSRPGTVSSSQPIAYSDGITKLFINGTNRNTIIMTGVDTEFLPINLDNTTNSVVCDCSASMVYGDGCITYDHATNVTLVRCEAAAAFNGSIGDGINAHGATGGTQRVHKTTGRLIDCWSHDNNDDGFSDHECCESEIYGGLYEYNGKAGITPSYGSHCKCIGVYSRKNYNGFYYTGATQSSELGVYGQLECINCIAESNKRGTSQNNAGYLAESTGNRMILSNCKSIDNKIGYYPTGGTLMTAIDCGSYGDTIIKTGGGTLTVINSTSITA